ncbi:MAG: MBL fold metallo-hydrolase [Planctomycetota bacterium]
MIARASRSLSPALPLLLLALLPAADAPAPGRKPADGVEAPKPPARLRIVWHGQACVEVFTPEGLCVLMDPAGNIGFPLPDFRPDAVTVSHEHFDHANLEIVKSKAKILRGLSDDKKSCRAIDEALKGVRITTVSAFHDDKEGKARGPNAIFVLRGATWSLAHLGDLGDVPSPELAKKIGGVDILLVPVGGKYTIDGAKAKETVERLKPRRAVIPMHYKVPGLRIEIADAEAFLKDQKNVRRLEGASVEIDLSAPPPNEFEIVALKPAEAKPSPAPPPDANLPPPPPPPGKTPAPPADKSPSPK